MMTIYRFCVIKNKQQRVTYMYNKTQTVPGCAVLQKC